MDANVVGSGLLYHLSDLEKLNHSVEADLKTERVHHKQTQKQLQEAQAQIKEAKQKYLSLCETVGSLTEQNNSIERENKDLKGTIQSKEAQITALQNQLKDEKMKYEEKREWMVQELEKFCLQQCSLLDIDISEVSGEHQFVNSPITNHCDTSFTLENAGEIVQENTLLKEEIDKLKALIESQHEVNRKLNESSDNESNALPQNNNAEESNADLENKLRMHIASLENDITRASYDLQQLDNYAQAMESKNEQLIVALQRVKTIVDQCPKCLEQVDRAFSSEC